MSRLARTRVYASTVHCSPDSEEPRERWMAGSAMFTIVASSPTIRRPVEQITSTSWRRRFELMSVTVVVYHVDDSHCRHENRDHGSLATDRKSTRLNSSHSSISYAVFCLKKKKKYKRKEY